MHKYITTALKHSVGFALVVNVLNGLSLIVWNCKESLRIFFLNQNVFYR